MSGRPAVSRRSFLSTGAATVAGAAVGFGILKTTRSAWAKSLAASAAGMKYRVLGARTGLKVSEIGFGGYPIRDPDVLRHARDLGINYVDTSDDYRDGDSERAIGKVLATDRDKFIITTKIHPWGATKQDEMMASLDGCLSRLRTSYVDVIAVHQVGASSGAADGDGNGDPIDRVRNPELHAFFAKARKQGKARFLGATGHDGDLMAIMDWVVASGKFDMILNRYNLVDYAEQRVLFAKAAKAGVGVTVMKTLAGARKADVKPYERPGATFAQSALRWVLANEHIASAVISISSADQATEYAAAPGTLTRADEDRLERWSAAHGREFCRMCNACEPACPHDVRVADLLRARMYRESHLEPARARDLWSASVAAGGDPALCVGCSAPCQNACEHGVAIKPRLTQARRMHGRDVLS